MPAPIQHFGIVGLGKMGGGVALNAIDHGFAVSAFDTLPVSDEMQRAGVRPAASLRIPIMDGDDNPVGPAIHCAAHRSENAEAGDAQSRGA